jgi:hypothetical protein
MIYNEIKILNRTYLSSVIYLYIYIHIYIFLARSMCCCGHYTYIYYTEP